LAPVLFWTPSFVLGAPLALLLWALDSLRSALCALRSALLSTLLSALCSLNTMSPAMAVPAPRPRIYSRVGICRIPNTTGSTGSDTRGAVKKSA
jgi:hypothetical protein